MISSQSGNRGAKPAVWCPRCRPPKVRGHTQGVAQLRPSSRFPGYLHCRCCGTFWSAPIGESPPSRIMVSELVQLEAAACR